MSIFDTCPGLQRRLEQQIWEIAPNKSGARAAVRLQRRFLEEVYDRVEGRTVMDGSMSQRYLNPECLLPLSVALKACYVLVSQAAEGTPESHLLGLHTNSLLAAVTLADERANQPATGQTLFRYVQFMSALNALKDAGEWTRAVCSELRIMRLEDLGLPLADNTRFLVMNVAAALFEPTNLLRLRPPLPVNIPRQLVNQEPTQLSERSVKLWGEYAMQVANQESPWLGLALLRALEDVWQYVRDPEGTPIATPEWLNRDLASLRDLCCGDAGRFMPHSDNTVRIIGIPEEDMRRCDLTNINRVFDEVEAGPAVHRLRGKITVTFPCFDSDSRPNYLIPEVRAFLVALHSARPHFLYFVLPDPRAGFLILHLFSLIPLDKLTVADNYRTTTNLSAPDLALFVATHLLPAVRFCMWLGDDTDAFLSEIAPNFPDPLWEVVHMLLLATTSANPVDEDNATDQ